MTVTTAENTVEDPSITSESAPAAPEAGPVVPAAPAPAPPRHADHGWVWQVSALSVILGIMLALAIRTTSQVRKTGAPRALGLSGPILAAYKEQSSRLEAENKDLHEQVKELENSIRTSSGSAQMLQDQLREARMLAGLSPVKGPGVKITLRDSPKERLPDLTPEDMDSYLVHDQDIYGLMNELRAAGAEALAISGADPKNLQRVIVTTAARCVGPTAVINGRSLSAPYTILAIGNSKELKNALEMPNGFIQNRGLDVLEMIAIEESQHLVLPEYSGSFSPKYARPATANP
jgi:uncharacterized protein YlxW (UPF0749 family)